MSKYDYVVRDHPIFYEEVTLEDLHVDPDIQRSLNMGRAKGIASSIIPSALSVLTVSRRTDGRLFILDGQHRTKALLLAGFKVWRAEIHEGLNTQEEAALFLCKNVESARVSAYDSFKACLSASMALETDIAAVLSKHGLEMASSASINRVGAVITVQNLVRLYGVENLDRTLGVLDLAFGRVERTWDGTFLGGVGKFLGEYGDLVNQARLVERMQAKGGPQRWLQQALENALSESGGGAANARVQGCFRALIKTYNAGLRTGRVGA